MANWFCSVFNVVTSRKCLSSPRCRSELIDSAWVVISPGQKCIKKNIKKNKKIKKYINKKESRYIATFLDVHSAKIDKFENVTV